MIHIGVAELLLLASAGCLLAAVILGTRAIRGVRELGAPRCAACGHDLRTYGPPPTACAECGADCTAPQAITYARRRRRRIDLVYGLACLALAAGLGAASILWVTWRLAAPVGGTLPTATEIAARAADGRDVPWRQLAQILRTTRPSAEERAALLERIEREGGAPALGLDAAGRFAFDDACATLMRSMDQRERRRLARAWAGPPVVVAPSRIEAGRPWTVTVRGRPAVDSAVLARSAEGIAQSSDPFVVAIRICGVRLGGGAVGGLAGESGAGGAVRLELPAPAGLTRLADGVPPTGTEHLELEVDVEQVIMLADDVPRSGLPANPSMWPPSIDEPRTTIRREVAVVGPDAEIVDRSVDPAVRPEMAGALRVTGCRIEGQGATRRLLIETMVVPPGGMHIAGRWQVSIGGRVVELGPIAAWGRPNNFAVDGDKRLQVPLRADESPTTVDVAIVPWAKAASSLPRDGTPAWGEAIERRGVRVQGR